jgi:hypothetical protein
VEAKRAYGRWLAASSGRPVERWRWRWAPPHTHNKRHRILLATHPPHTHQLLQDRVEEGAAVGLAVPPTRMLLGVRVTKQVQDAVVPAAGGGSG